MGHSEGHRQNLQVSRHYHYHLIEPVVRPNLDLVLVGLVQLEVEAAVGQALVQNQKQLIMGGRGMCHQSCAGVRVMLQARDVR